MNLNRIIMGVDVASMTKNIDIGQIAYDTVSESILIYDGSIWRYVKQDTIESKFEKRKRIISKLLSEK
ncbi:MAG: hypothetical protein RLZZ546_733 [Bacteroidota bacterium]